jgi:hypothetical protein
MATTFRVIFAMLAQTLADQSDSIRAEKVVDYCLKAIPSYNVPYDFYPINELANTYHRIGATEKANDLYRQLTEILMKNLDWYTRMDTHHYISVINNVRRDISCLEIILNYWANNNTEVLNTYLNDYTYYVDRYRQVVDASKKTQKGGLNR